MTPSGFVASSSDTTVGLVPRYATIWPSDRSMRRPGIGEKNCVSAMSDK